MQRRRRFRGGALMAPFDMPPRAPDGSSVRPRTPRRRTGSSREQASEAQRTRILSAMVEVASEVGTESATVTQIVRRAGVSSGTFYTLFEDRQDCLNAVFEEGVTIATKHVSAAYDTEAGWVDRVRAAVLALLELLDEERELARLCVGHAVASPTMLLRRGEVLDELIPIIDQGRGASGREEPAIARRAGRARRHARPDLLGADRPRPAFAGGAPEPVDVADRSPLPWRFGSTRGAIPAAAGASLRERVNRMRLARCPDGR